MESIYTTNIGQRHKPGPPPPSPGASSPLPPSLWPPLQALAPALAPTQEAPPHPSDRLRLPPRFQASTHTPSVESERFGLRFRLLLSFLIPHRSLVFNDNTAQSGKNTHCSADRASGGPGSARLLRHRCLTGGVSAQASAFRGFPEQSMKQRPPLHPAPAGPLSFHLMDPSSWLSLPPGICTYLTCPTPIPPCGL